MRFLMIAALLPLAASFASTAKPPYEPPEGLALIRDSYQFDNTEHPMTGLTPDSPGPHKLIVVLYGSDVSAYETEFGAHDKAFILRRGALEKAVAMQGHGMVVVEIPGVELYPDNAGALLSSLLGT